eukprot:g27299.t1
MLVLSARLSHQRLTDDTAASDLFVSDLSCQPPRDQMLNFIFFFYFIGDNSQDLTRTTSFGKIRRCLVFR